MQQLLQQEKQRILNNLRLRSTSIDGEILWQRLKALGYEDVGFFSRLSPWGMNKAMDMKYPQEYGRFQLRVGQDGNCRLDYDLIDPDANIITALTHSVVDLSSYMIREVGSVIGMTDKNHLEFNLFE